MPVVVRGLANINAGFKNTHRDIRAGWRLEQRHIAEPVASDTERLALLSIRHMPASPQWSRMRIGITRSMVYVAPRQRGVRWNSRSPGSRFQARRPNLGDLLMDRAMQPALERHETQIVQEVRQLLDLAAAGFN